jgi:3-phosphoshikimate 1-carboxyvinyltransferase
VSALRLEPATGGLRGRLRVPGDKSVSHRALLLAALAGGRSRIRGLSGGSDVAATARAVRLLGAEVSAEAPAGAEAGSAGGAVVTDLVVSGGRLHEPERPIDVGNSGTGIRLLAGVAAGIDGLTVLHGDQSVGHRPMERVVDPLRAMGARVDGRQGGRRPPLAVRGGPLQGIDWQAPVASAQVKGAILLAALGAAGPTTVRLPGPSRTHTEDMLAERGVRLEVEGWAVTVHPGPVAPLDTDVPGDPSQAAFWVVAACLVPGSDLVVEDVYLGPERSGFLDVLARMGAAVEVVDADPARGVADLRARYGPLTATEVGGLEVPGLIDEIPILAVAAAFAEGTTVFRDAAELRVKESDRIASVVGALRSLGMEAEEHADGLSVRGSGSGPRACSAGRRAEPAGRRVDAAGDHRVAMAAAVAALAAAEPVTIEGWEAVATSYPGFEADLARCLS